MRKQIIIGLAVLACTLLQGDLRACILAIPGDTLTSHDTIQDSVRVIPVDPTTSATEESFRKKKLITSILAFPIPFGFVGLHRIYLGTEPWVPIVYLCTGGGGVGLLPLIDFLYIVTANEEEFKKYENNPKVIMFVD